METDIVRMEARRAAEAKKVEEASAKSAEKVEKAVNESKAAEPVKEAVK